MWTEERVDLLKKLWAEGLSASQIAKQLGGVTRNAVIGKVHRLGLSGRATSNRAPRSRPQTAAPANLQARAEAAPAQAQAAAALPKEKPLSAPAPISRALPEIVDGGATVLSLTEHTCKWPIGDPGESNFHFCGQRSAPNMPYCAEHARLAYQPVQPRKRADRRRDYAV
ncbi:GcrA family cell cycle regulator [Tepidicaulis sp. LMO-SS28]|uniref:GcrA family cell cycle regulator n=1 Tax=Tepidicaulis sp. LMO-SS28 TaxID=3447455 RepID=UPI003EE36A6A